MEQQYLSEGVIYKESSNNIIDLAIEGKQIHYGDYFDYITVVYVLPELLPNKNNNLSSDAINRLSNESFKNMPLYIRQLSFNCSIDEKANFADSRITIELVDKKPNRSYDSYRKKSRKLLEIYIHNLPHEFEKLN